MSHREILVTREVFITEINALKEALERMWTQQCIMAEHLTVIAKNNTRTLGKGDIQEDLEREVLAIFYTHAQVEQGDGKQFNTKFLRKLQEKHPGAIVPEALHDYIKGYLVPTVRRKRAPLKKAIKHVLFKEWKNHHDDDKTYTRKDFVASLQDQAERERIVLAAMRSCDEWLCSDKSRPPEKPGLTKAAFAWWLESLLAASKALPGSRVASPYFGFVDGDKVVKRHSYEVEDDNGDDNDKGEEEAEGADDEPQKPAELNLPGASLFEKSVSKPSGSSATSNRSLFASATSNRSLFASNEGEPLSQPDEQAESASFSQPMDTAQKSDTVVLKGALENAKAVVRTGPGRYNVVPKKPTTITKAAQGRASSTTPIHDKGVPDSLAEPDASQDSDELPLSRRPRPSSSQRSTTTTTTAASTAAATSNTEPSRKRSAAPQDTAKGVPAKKARATALSKQLAAPNTDDDDPTELDVDAVCEIARSLVSLKSPQSPKEAPLSQPDPTPTSTSTRKSHRNRALTERAREASTSKAPPSTALDEATGRVWLAALKSATIGTKGVVRYRTIIERGKDRSTRNIADLPDWAIPPPEVFLGAIQMATEASDIEWDEVNSTIVLNFDTLPSTMTRNSVPLYIGYQR